MTKYIKISDLIREQYSKEVIDELLGEVLEITLSAKQDYPDFLNWFLKKQVPGVYGGNRDIILAIKKDEIIGVACVKNDGEKKICSLYVKPDRRRNKEGILLVEKTFEVLDTTTPLITMPISKVEDFLPMIHKYDWILSNEIDDCYKENTTELIFNDVMGPLSCDSLGAVLDKIYTKKKDKHIIYYKYRFLSQLSLFQRLIWWKSVNEK